MKTRTIHSYEILTVNRRNVLRFSFTPTTSKSRSELPMCLVIAPVPSCTKNAAGASSFVPVAVSSNAKYLDDKLSKSSLFAQLYFGTLMHNTDLTLIISFCLFTV